MVPFEPVVILRGGLVPAIFTIESALAAAGQAMVLQAVGRKPYPRLL
jgi:hypothetical protein